MHGQINPSVAEMTSLDAAQASVNMLRASSSSEDESLDRPTTRVLPNGLAAPSLVSCLCLCSFYCCLLTLFCFFVAQVYTGTEAHNSESDNVKDLTKVRRCSIYPRAPCSQYRHGSSSLSSLARAIC
jgi:hypothetical protein